MAIKQTKVSERELGSLNTKVQSAGISLEN